MLYFIFKYIPTLVVVFKWLSACLAIEIPEFKPYYYPKVKTTTKQTKKPQETNKQKTLHIG
jgi:hypothetical protein